MCDELGDDTMMTNYITSAGKTSLCSTETLKGCNEKEVAYINKMKAASSDDVAKQLTRLSGMDAKAMTTELADWLSKRLAILKSLSGGHTEL